MIELLIVCIIVFAFFGESIFGFGGGLISIPLISLILGVKDAVTLVLIFQLCMGLLIYKSHQKIDLKVAKPMTISIVIGTIVGTLLLSKSGTVLLQLFLAFSILAFLAKSLYFSGFTLSKRTSQVAPIGVGLGGGLFQGLIGAGGPVLTMYLSVAVTKKLSLRATLIYLFFITSLVRVAISTTQHLFNDKVVHLALVVLPFFLLAILIGQRLHKKVSDKYYHLAINIILAASALVLVLKAIF